MWKRFACYLSGQHQYGVWCESGTIYLRCPHCGKRTNGWAIQGKQTKLEPLVSRTSETIRGRQASSNVTRFPAQSALR